jgi:hypothetical protein
MVGASVAGSIELDDVELTAMSPGGWRAVRCTLRPAPSAGGATMAPPPTESARDETVDR